MPPNGSKPTAKSRKPGQFKIRKFLSQENFELYRFYKSYVIFNINNIPKLIAKRNETSCWLCPKDSNCKWWSTSKFSFLMHVKKVEKNLHRQLIFEIGERTKKPKRRTASTKKEQQNQNVPVQADQEKPISSSLLESNEPTESESTDEANNSNYRTQTPTEVHETVQFSEPIEIEMIEPQAPFELQDDHSMRKQFQPSINDNESTITTKECDLNAHLDDPEQCYHLMVDLEPKFVVQVYHSNIDRQFPHAMINTCESTVEQQQKMKKDDDQSTINDCGLGSLKIDHISLTDGGSIDLDFCQNYFRQTDDQFELEQNFNQDRIIEKSCDQLMNNQNEFIKRNQDMNDSKSTYEFSNQNFNEIPEPVESNQQIIDCDFEPYNINDLESTVTMLDHYRFDQTTVADKSKPQQSKFKKLEIKVSSSEKCKYLLEEVPILNWTTPVFNLLSKLWPETFRE